MANPCLLKVLLGLKLFDTTASVIRMVKANGDDPGKISPIMLYCLYLISTLIASIGEPRTTVRLT